MSEKTSPKFTRNQAQRLIKILAAIRDGENIPSLIAIDLDILESFYSYLESELEKSTALRKTKEELDRLWLSSPSSGRR